MNEFIQRAPYPVHVLPPVLQDFAQQVVAATESSYEMVVPVMLSGMSAAVQGVADVETPYGEVMPTSLFACVVAKSGDRKSSVLKKVMRGFEDFERGRFPEDLNPNSAAFKSHKFLIEDATNKGVIDIFKEGAHSLFYAMDEGAILFKNLDMPTLCKRFDGSAINEASRTQGVTLLHDRRVALCMLTQNVTFDRWVGKKSDLLVESGFMPRMLISQATSQSGSCGWNPAPVNDGNIALHSFHQRVRELLKEYARALDFEEFTRKSICFDKNSMELWEKYILNVDLALNLHGEWEEVRAFMRRSGELVIRVAAVLQYFIDPLIKIQPWAVQASIEIVRWHLHEVKRIFGEESLESQLKKDVDQLFKYIIGRCQRTENKYIAKGELLRYGPKSLRKSDVLDIAIQNLCSMGKLQLLKYGRKEFLYINDFYNGNVINLVPQKLRMDW